MSQDTELEHLHPNFAVRVEQLLDFAQRVKNMPIELYEGWRSPDRQALLYAKGRAAGVGEPGHHVTFERAWQSSHQYGMAGDFVWFLDGKWSWEPPAGHSWQELYEIADKIGLQHLDFEKPHLQMPNFSGRRVLSGQDKLPPDGGSDWEVNMEQAIIAWGPQPKVVSGILHPGAPSPPGEERPVIQVPEGMVWDDRKGTLVPAGVV